MPLAIYTSAAWTANGGLEPASQALVTVRNEATGALASVFSDRAGNNGLGNPFNADDQGRFSFFVEGGAYRITVESGGESQELRYQAVGTASEKDTGESNAQIPTNDDLDARGFAQSVDSVEDLRASSFPANLERLWLSGYSEQGRGGGPLRKIGSGFTSADDNGATEFVDDDGFKWARPCKGFVTVDEAGAIPDGDRSTLTGTDNFDAFLNAIRTGQAVVVPEIDDDTSYYLIDLENNGEITDDLIGVTIMGHGRSSRVLFYYDSAEFDSMTGAHFNKSTKKIAWLRPDVTDGVLIHDILFNGGSERLKDGTSEYGCSWVIYPSPQADDDCQDITLERCYFTELWEGPVQTDRTEFFTKGLQYRNNYVKDIGKHGAGLNWVRDVTISDSEYDGCGNDDFGPGTPGGLAVDVSRNCRNVTIDNLTVRRAKSIFKVEATSLDDRSEDVTISNITATDFLSDSDYMIKLEGHNMSISNIVAESTRTGKSCIDIDEFCGDFEANNLQLSCIDDHGIDYQCTQEGEKTISNSTITHQGTTTSGLNFLNSTGSVLDAGVTFDNVVVQSENNAIRFGGPNGWKGVHIDGGKYKSSGPQCISLDSGVFRESSIKGADLVALSDSTRGLQGANDCTVTACELSGLLVTGEVANTGVASITLGDTASDYNLVKDNRIRDDFASIVTQGANTIETDNIEFPA